MNGTTKTKPAGRTAKKLPRRNTTTRSVALVTTTVFVAMTSTATPTKKRKKIDVTFIAESLQLFPHIRRKIIAGNVVGRFFKKVASLALFQFPARLKHLGRTIKYHVFPIATA